MWIANSCWSFYWCSLLRDVDKKSERQLWQMCDVLMPEAELMADT